MKTFRTQHTLKRPESRRHAPGHFGMAALFLYFISGVLFMTNLNAQPELSDGLYAEIDTEKGIIYCELEYKLAPLTVSNFVGLAEGTINHDEGDGPYYDGLNFHRVVDDFVIQGGCPQGTGTGGPGYSFPDEFDSSLRHDTGGILSMANSGANTNGSQFFITHKATPHLDDRHSIFGKVVQGMDIVNRIEPGDRIKSITILRIGDDAEDFTVTQESFDDLVANIEKVTRDKIARAQKGLLKQITDKWPDLTTTDSGVYFEVLADGSGDLQAQSGSTVTVHYELKLLNDSVIQSSFDGDPAEFSLDKVIPGWRDGILADGGMKIGEKRRLVIPPHLGYGEQGYPGVIPPNSFLVFVVELLKLQ